jgi:hypothetical protein
MAEPGVRVICGDTTAQIAARLLGAELELEPRPADGWKEVPPASRFIPPEGGEKIDLVTEGLVTLRATRQRLAQGIGPGPGARRADGATQLARLLLQADKVHFVVGLAVNPVQATREGIPLRKEVIEALADDLRARGKIVTISFV